MQNKLLNLIRANMEVPRQFNVKAQGDEATIYLYDVIDKYFGISAEMFVKALMAITASVIHVRIDSPGGDVFEARAIATAIRQHASTIVAHVDGLAASAATYIATSASEVRIADGAFMMTHKAWTIAMGNSVDMRGVADLLDKIDGTIEQDYMKKTGADQATVSGWMAEETWFTAQEAIAAKLADTLVAVEQNGGTKNAWNLSAYDKVPKALLETPKPKPPAYDRAALERKLKLYDQIAA
jgi:ATP-dependent Clp protease protease subunit